MTFSVTLLVIFKKSPLTFTWGATGIHIPNHLVVPDYYKHTDDFKVALQTSEVLLNHKIFSKILIWFYIIIFPVFWLLLIHLTMFWIQTTSAHSTIIWSTRLGFLPLRGTGTGFVGVLPLPVIFYLLENTTLHIETTQGSHTTLTLL